VTWDPNKRILTTGDIAELCGVNFRTVIRWIQNGHLKAFQLPGRGDNRVLIKDFLEFLRANNMPLPEELEGTGEAKILIVEDDKRMAQSMQRALKRKGFETMIALEGFMAGVVATTFKPTVMTLDLKMPGLGGLDILKGIRKNPDLSGIKILVVSAMPQEELDAAIAGGADDVLEKPFANADLVAKVANLAGVRLT
jgi:excisionase family DNA binding protein